MIIVVKFILEIDVVLEFEEFSMCFTKGLINTYHDELPSNLGCLSSYLSRIS